MSPSPSLILLLILFPSSGTAIKVFSLQDDLWSGPRLDVYIKYDLWRLNSTPVTTDTFTLCYRAKHSSLVYQVMYASYAETQEVLNGLVIFFEGENLNLYYLNAKQTHFDYKKPFNTHVWQHFCHVFTQGWYLLYLDGEMAFRSRMNITRKEMTFNGTFVIGQEQDTFGEGFIATEMFRGQLAQYNIWDTQLNEDLIRDIAKCKSQDRGNILSSDIHMGEFVNVSISIVDLASLCQDTVPFIVIPVNLLFPDAADFCRMAGLVMYTPDSAKNNALLNNRSQDFQKQCIYSLWVGVTDEAEEGVWRSLATNEVSSTFFEANTPNGRDKNCVSTIHPSGNWYMESCSTKVPRCFSCGKSSSEFMILRGLCFSYSYMRFVEILDNKNSTPFFHGLYRYNMKYSPGSWQLIDTHKNETVANFSAVSDNIYPLGLTAWTLEKAVCEHPEGETILLGLSVCRDDQFMCSNGDCVPGISRCDAFDDCPDQSDEDECHIITIPPNYRPQRPPKTETKGSPLVIVAHVDVLRLLVIEDSNNAVSIEFYITLYWQDTRLKYTNLRNTPSKVSDDVREKLWRPAIEFPNVLNGQPELLRETVTVKRLGESLPPDMNRARMDREFPSQSGLLGQKRHYAGKFSCTFNMFYFPLDTQRCFLVVQLAATSPDLASFNTSSVTFHGEDNVGVYIVHSFRAEVDKNFTSQTDLSAVKVIFLLARHPMGVMIQMFVPTTMLVAIGYSTLHVNLALTQVRVVVSLTTLLVLYTLYDQTNSSLPQTAYIKMIDVWFFVCICILFTVILFHIYVEKLTRSEDKSETKVWAKNERTEKERGTKSLSAERVLHVFRMRVVPACLLIYLVVFCSIIAIGSQRQKHYWD